MSMDLFIVVNPTHLHVVTKGVFTLGEARDNLLEVIKACRTYARPLVLVDWRQLFLPNMISTLDTYRGASFLAAQVAILRGSGLGRVRMAFVSKEDRVDQGRFGETVAINRGVHLKTTSSMSEALTWLGVEGVDKLTP